MNMPLSSVWPRVLELLKNELTEISYNTWIQTIEPISMNQTSIELGVPTEFNKGIIESRYAALISNAIKAVTSKEYNVIVTVPSLESSRKKTSSYEPMNSEDSTSSILNPK